MLYKGGFEIEYGTPGSYVTGDYIEETISMSGVTVTNMTMAVANASAHEQFGILGVGFDINESWVTNGRPEPYLNIIDLLVSQGIINTRAYSLYLNDKGNGSSLFPLEVHFVAYRYTMMLNRGCLN